MTNEWYKLIISDVEKSLNTDSKQGIKSEEIYERRAKYGYNELKEGKKKSLLVKFLEQFKDTMVIILIIAAIISAVVDIQKGEAITDTFIILGVIICNAIIGVAQESKAEKSLEALKKLSSHAAKVVRDGKLIVIPSRELVPGDLVELETGDFVPADMRIVEAVNLKSQESSLTGESVPTEKNNNTLSSEHQIGIGDRTNMLYSSSLITYGRGRGIVTATGMNTEVGMIAQSLNDAVETETPLQIKLDKLGKILGIGALVICLIIFLVGIIFIGKDWLDMLMTAVSLAVAAIPEGLAAVSTIVLAIGVQRMVKRHAIVKKLPAVETLGCATVICSDKTGTLTQNKMTVLQLFYNGKLVDVNDIKVKPNELNRLMDICVLCNDTKTKEDGTYTGDPTETALIAIADKLGYDLKLYKTRERVEEYPFDSERKLMTTVNKFTNKYLVLTKGGIDELLACCNSYLLNGEVKTNLSEFKDEIEKQNTFLASQALRVLAMGYKELDHIPTKEEMKNIESDLTYVGMVGMIDPPREEVKAAVAKCKTAGIKTVMITGDHKATAVAIAKSLGILENEDEAILGSDVENMTDEYLKENVRKFSVYARVSPEHKVRIVKAWQANGEIVAMTGDGVNDAPALKNADIGCAMGIVGTDVSKEAADVILTDDNFATIVAAVEEGRRIYDNILKAIQFLLSSNVGEIIVLFLATLLTNLFASEFSIDASIIEVLTPVHLLWINLVTDSLPALALAVDPPEADVMERKPNRNKGIFSKGMVWRIVYQGLMIGLLALSAFVIGIATPDEEAAKIAIDNNLNYVTLVNDDGIAEKKMVYQNDEDFGKAVANVKVEIGQSMAFIVLAFSELIHIFNIRNSKKSIFKTGIGGNKLLFLALAVDSLLMFVVLLVPQIRTVFGIPVLPTNNIYECIGLVFAPIVIVEIMKLLKINSSKDE